MILMMMQSCCDVVGVMTIAITTAMMGILIDMMTMVTTAITMAITMTMMSILISMITMAITTTNLMTRCEKECTKVEVEEHTACRYFRVWFPNPLFPDVQAHVSGGT